MNNLYVKFEMFSGQELHYTYINARTHFPQEMYVQVRSLCVTYTCYRSDIVPYQFGGKPYVVQIMEDLSSCMQHNITLLVCLARYTYSL